MMDEFSNNEQETNNANKCISHDGNHDMPSQIQNKSNVDQGELKFEATFKYTDDIKCNNLNSNQIDFYEMNSVPYKEESNRREHESQQSIEKKDIAIMDSSYDSDDPPENIQNMADILPILAELNESAVECINQENYEEALDSLLKAEYVISVLIPSKSGAQISNQISSTSIPQVENTYISTIYYNLACVCQKLSKLEECVKYLNKCITALETYCKLSTSIQLHENYTKLVINNSNSLPKASQYSDLLMKYRYLAKFNLQLCAVLSQLSEHTNAIDKGKLAVGFCQESIGVTEALCSKVLAYFNKKQEFKSPISHNKEQEIDNPSLAYSVTAETKRQSNESNSISSQLKRRKSEEPNERKSRFLGNRSSLFESRAHSVSSNSSTMSIIMKEETKIDHLERLHSFSMKRASSTSNDSRGLESMNEINTQRSTIDKQSRNSSTNVCYVEEKFKGCNDAIIKSSQILKEACRQIKEFRAISFKNTAQRERFFSNRIGVSKRMKVSFETEDEIDRIRHDQTFKLNIRNALGVKSSEDWIFNLYIGNVMHLSPLSFDDLHCSFIVDSIRRRVNQELSKDMLLEKIVLLTVGYFCVGTEFRFMNTKSKSGEIDKEISEIWLAKALHTAITFLPSECPLVNHVKTSYSKHHLTHKINLKHKVDCEEEIKLKGSTCLTNKDSLNLILENDSKEIETLKSNKHEEK